MTKKNDEALREIAESLLPPGWKDHEYGLKHKITQALQKIRDEEEKKRVRDNHLYLEYVDSASKELSKEKEKTGKLVEALKRISSRVHEKVDIDERTYYEWPTKSARIAKQAIEEYEK